MEQETHEKYFYGTEHWNYFTNDEDLGPVILSLKQETINGRDQFRYLHLQGPQNGYTYSQNLTSTKSNWNTTESNFLSLPWILHNQYYHTYYYYHSIFQFELKC